MLSLESAACDLASSFSTSRIWPLNVEAKAILSMLLDGLLDTLPRLSLEAGKLASAPSVVDEWSSGWTYRADREILFCLAATF